MLSMSTTQDRILDGQVILHQPREGYRVAVDPVFLGAAVTARAGERVLDLGCGVGAAMLCLARRVPGLEIDGLEVQPELCELARTNIAANGFQTRVRAYTGDLLAPPTEMKAGSYDGVFANPPYLSADRGHPPPNASKRTAHVEGEATLRDWIAAALKFCKPKGGVTVILRADRLADLLAAFGAAGEIVVFPLWPKAGKSAGRVIVRARKGVKTPLEIKAGLVLHDTDGHYTQAAERILKGEALCIRV